MPQTDNEWQSSEDTQLLENLATQAALTLNWNEAAKINQKILAISQDNIAALNRLARALLCLGEITKSLKIYKKVIEIDPYNIIAKKNVEKLQKSAKNPKGAPVQNSFDPTVNYNLTSLFVFEPGKTKVINLINPAPSSTLATFASGDRLLLNPKNHQVTVITQSGTYIGALPDDLAHRLITFIAGGNKYEVYVKSASIKNIAVFIKEVERSQKFTNQPSFQSSANPYLQDEVIQD